MNWQAGIARAVITPETPVWLAGYGHKREPTGKIHELWVKTLALADSADRRAVMVTCDQMGIPKSMYDQIRDAVATRHGLEQSQLMILFSHNHCGPVLRDDLVDYYPSDDAQPAIVAAYTDHVTQIMIDSVDFALADLRPVRLSIGDGITRFAVNRRDNPESEVAARQARGESLAGRVDHTVPVMTIRSEDDALIGILFGYACHPTTMSFTEWCGDYPGYAQLALEASHPGVTAMFFPGCGADQNPLPRRQLNLCERYGNMLAAAVEEVLLTPLAPLSDRLDTAFQYVDLDYESVISIDMLTTAVDAEDVRGRWARRWLDVLDRQPDVALPTSYPYPIQVWQLGAHVMIALGGEAVVDYAHRFREMFGRQTWVSGYANTLVAYMPSTRVHHEGGYEGGAYLHEYGHGADRWAADVEERIVEAVTTQLGRIRESVRRDV